MPLASLTTIAALATAAASGQAIYELDRQAGTVTEAVIAVGVDDDPNAFDMTGSPAYSRDAGRIGFDVTYDEKWSLCRVAYWTRATDAVTVVGRGNYATFTPGDAEILSQTLYGDGSLVAFDVPPPHAKRSLGTRLRQPKLSPDGTLLMTQAATDEPRTESLAIARADALGEGELTFAGELLSRAEFARSPTATLPDGRPILCTIVAVLEGGRDEETGEMHTGLFALDVVSADADNPEDTSRLVGLGRLLLARSEATGPLHYPAGAWRSDEVAFRFGDQKAGFAIGVLRQDQPGEYARIIQAPPSVYVAQVAMSPNAQFVAFKSNLFHRGPIRGRLYEASDLLPDAAE